MDIASLLLLSVFRTIVALFLTFSSPTATVVDLIKVSAKAIDTLYEYNISQFFLVINVLKIMCSAFFLWLCG